LSELKEQRNTDIDVTDIVYTLQAKENRMLLPQYKADTRKI